MQKSCSRLFSSSKKAFLIKLASVLGFGGMVSFCILSCDKPVNSERGAVQEREPAKVEASEAVIAQPAPLEGVVAVEAADVVKPSADVAKPSADVAKPSADVAKPNADVAKPPSVLIAEPPEREIRKKYGPPSDPKPVIAVRYGVVMPEE